MTRRAKASEKGKRAVAEEAELGGLRAHPRNYRKHPEKQLEHLIASIRKNGFYRNIVVARDGTILAGHGLAEAARRAGYEKVPVYRIDIEAESPEALRIMTADNELGRFAETDEGALAELLGEVLEGGGEGLLGTGYDEGALEALVERVRGKEGGGEEFPDYGEEGAVETTHKCPRCSYEWSGASK